MAEQQNYSIIAKNGTKCWIRFEEVNSENGRWQFVFPSLLDTDEIANEIEKYFKEDPKKYKIIQFQPNRKMIVVNSAELNGVTVRDYLEELLG